MPNRPKRNIQVKEGEKIVYEGEDKRWYNQDYKPLRCALGIPIFEWLKVGFWVVGVVVFVVKVDLRIKALEDGHIRLVSVIEDVKNYMNNADNWNSSIYGARFKGGSPVDGAYKKNEGYITKGGN